MNKILRSSIIILLTAFIIGCNNKNVIKKSEIPNDKIEILKASDLDKLLVANINLKTTVLDYEGNQLFIADKLDKNINISNGFVYTSNIDSTNYIYNKSGDRKSFKGTILSISKSGYALIEKIRNLKYEIVDLNTYEVIKQYDNSKKYKVSYTGYKDYFLYEQDITKELFDAKSKTTYENYFENEDFILKEGKIFKNELLPFENNHGKVLSLNRNLYYEDNKIYNKNLKELYDFKSGSIKYIYYYDKKIFIYSNEGMVCVLDKDLNYILEPITVDDTDLSFLKNYKNDFNDVINNDNISGYDFNVQITDNAIFKISLINNKESIKTFEIKIIDNETIDESLSYNVDVKNDTDISVTNNGIVINDSKGDLLIINKDGMKKFKNSIGRVYSDNIIGITKSNKQVAYNIKNMKKIELMY